VFSAPTISQMSPTGAPTGFPVTANLRRKNTSSFLNPFAFAFSLRYFVHYLLIEDELNSSAGISPSITARSVNIDLLTSSGCFSLFKNFSATSES
jgi:hypothetical protein